MAPPTCTCVNCKGNPPAAARTRASSSRRCLGRLCWATDGKGEGCALAGEEASQVMNDIAPVHKHFLGASLAHVLGRQPGARPALPSWASHC